MRILIVDDDECARLHLRFACEQLGTVEIAGEFEDAFSAHAFLKDNPVDLILLDIEMPRFSGMDLVRSARELPAIIFITSKEDYAAAAFNYIDHVVDYIVKPVSLPRLQKALERFAQPRDNKGAPIPEASNPFIFVKADKRYVRIDLDDLLYVESLGDYSVFKTARGKHVANTPLKEIHKQLRSAQFIKVHRSYIVNMTKIVDIESNSLVIGGKVIPISRSHRNELMRRLPLL
ncbi:MAG: response regulator transcription factor [Phaeodactylibacter sp.]|nr:response regulator transcription factor [Phaeodactylibacter sp.]MCB9296646.1 response regulator transcription factor [Lewinellaceae bacterium]